MNRLSVITVGILLFSATCFAQTTTNDSQTLQALLSEVRQMRQDLRTTTIAAQRSQILIYRLQGQEARVARASERLDEAREKQARIQDERRHVAAEVRQNEDFVNNSENPATQRKAFEIRLYELKTRLQTLESDDQQSQSREIEAEQQLRAEEVRLGELREQLDRLDKTLENASRRADGGGQ